MQQSESWLTSKDRLKLYTQEWQVKKAKAVLCIVHGIGEHSGRYSHMAEFFQNKAYAVMAFDLRGHGRSEGKRGHAPDYDFMMDDISIFLDNAMKQYPKTRIFLFGHSLGGNLVLNYALRRKPELTSVIASGPLLKLVLKPSTLKTIFGKLLYHIIPDFMMQNGLDFNAISRDPEIIKAYLNDPLVHSRITPRFALDFLNAGIWALNNASDFPLPLLLMHGEQDVITSVKASQEFAERMGKRCQLKIWEGCFHEVHNEPVKDEFFKYIINWMEKFK